ncbi:MAG TPA: L-serine ammonia-lyase, iron-sulfur-dependent, subunit alpha [bacterium]|nr:L-serine ammonia-lyase, iron-sulfur-dependent, subunit alpha [bacterium]
MAFSVQDILRMEVAPALGCTEPAAIAYCAAAAASVLPDKMIEAIKVWVDGNIYKNGIAVSIPGAPGLTGLDMAAALGALGGDATRRLEVLDPIDERTVRLAKGLIGQGAVKVNLLENQTGLFIRVTVRNGASVGEAIIREVHDNIVSLTLDGQSVATTLGVSSESEGDGELARLEEWLRTVTLETLLEMLDNLSEDDFAFLQESITLNLRLAEYGLKHGPGLGVGKTFDRLAKQRLLKRDMILEARILASAASDARMAGVKLPAMSSAGSGNHGLTAVLPIYAVKNFIEYEQKTLLEAIAFSHLVTAYVKAHTGRLSAVCGCSIAAGAGAAAGVTYLLGGDIHHIAGAISNLIEDLAGVICDGAKGSCALKLATAAGTAVQAALFALQGVTVHSAEGIIGASFQKTSQNIGTLSRQGMIEADRTILKIMLEKRFAGY